jgi:hypothetical protein
MTAPLHARLFLDLRMQAAAGGVATGSLVSATDPQGYLTPQEEAAVRADTAGRRVIVVVHGFNVDRSFGRATLGKFMELIAPGVGDAMQLAVLWPGDSRFGALAYAFEAPAADDSAAALSRRIQDWLDPTARLSFIAHSKGCRVVMKCIQDLRYRRVPHKIEQICLLAAAMDDDSLTNRTWYGFADATREAARVAVLSSVNDQVLNYAYPIGDLLQGWFYFASDEPGRALGYRGPIWRSGGDAEARTRLFHEATPANFGVGHGDYLPAAGVVSDKSQRTADFARAVVSNAPTPEY